VDQLHALTATLTASTSTVERHKLLRQYRELLEQADKAATLEERGAGHSHEREIWRAQGKAYKYWQIRHTA